MLPNDPLITALVPAILTGIIALASLFVSIASYRLTRDERFGYPPVMNISDWSLEVDRHRPGEGRFLFTIEIWNRRRYAICFNRIVVDFSTITPALLDSEGLEDEDWNIEGRRLSLYGRYLVKPSDNITIYVELVLKPGWKSPFQEDIDLIADYFDPLSAQPLSAHGTYRIRNAVENTKLA